MEGVLSGSVENAVERDTRWKNLTAWKEKVQLQQQLSRETMPTEFKLTKPADCKLEFNSSTAAMAIVAIPWHGMAIVAIIVLKNNTVHYHSCPLLREISYYIQNHHPYHHQHHPISLYTEMLNVCQGCASRSKSNFTKNKFMTKSRSADVSY